MSTRAVIINDSAEVEVMIPIQNSLCSHCLYDSGTSCKWCRNENNGTGIVSTLSTLLEVPVEVLEFELLSTTVTPDVRRFRGNYSAYVIYCLGSVLNEEELRKQFPANSTRSDNIYELLEDILATSKVAVSIPDWMRCGE